MNVAMTTPRYMGAAVTSIRERWCTVRRRGPLNTLQRLIGATGSGGVGLGEQREQLVEIDRLRQVGLEAGVERVPDVVGLAIPGQRDEPGVTEPFAGAEHPRDLEPVDIRQSDVAEDDLRPERPGALDGLLAGFDGLDARTLDLQHVLEDVPRVRVVLDDEDRSSVEPRARRG